MKAWLNIIRSDNNSESGLTLAEILVVLGIILIIGTLAIPSMQQVKRRHYEDVAMLKLKEAANAEKMYYLQYKRFGTYRELVDAGLLPRGYTTRLEYWNPVTGVSVRPFIEGYSVRFLVPDSPNSLFFKIIAYPMDDSLNLTPMNINMYLNIGPESDSLFKDPPIRRGLMDDGPPIIVK